MCYIWPSTKIICGWLQAHIPAFLTKKKQKKKKSKELILFLFGGISQHVTLKH